MAKKKQSPWSFQFSPNFSWAFLAYSKGALFASLEFDIKAWGISFSLNVSEEEAHLLVKAGPFGLGAIYEFKAL